MTPVRYPSRVAYRPIPVKTLLKNMKNFSSLMLDLAYYSVLYMDRRLAKEVMRLEEFVDTMRSLLIMQAALAVRDAEDAETMVSVFRLATSTDKISDAAADIASIALLGMKVHPSLSIAIVTSDEVVSRIKVRDDSWIHGRRLEEVFGQEEVFVDVLALRRGESWYLNPPMDIQVKNGDVLIVRGDRDAVEKLRKAAKDEVPREEVIPPVSSYIEVAREIADLKNVADLMVDLAYHATMFEDEDVAREVLELEDYVDSKCTLLEREVISKLSAVERVEEVVTTIRVIMSLESIADAAAELASIIVSGLKPHPILKSVVEESEERILLLQVPERLSGVTIDDLGLYERGASVIAVKRGGEWIFDPEDTQEIKAGDILIVRVFSEAVEALRGMFGVEREAANNKA